MDYLSKFINFLHATKNLSPKTLKAYTNDLKQFFNFETNILHPDICAFVSHQNLLLRLKDTSIRRKIITLKISTLPTKLRFNSRLPFYET